MATALDAPQRGTQAEQPPAMDLDALRIGALPPRGLSGAERLVGGQLDELCDVFLRDSPLHEDLGHPSKAKPQVSLKRVGLF